jgi:multidrug efflux pump subunit AcrB
VTQLGLGPYSPFPVAWRVSGPDVGTLRDIADKVKGVLQASPMMRTVNTDWGSRVPVLHFTLDQNRLQATGLTSSAVAAASVLALRRANYRCEKIFAR